MVLHWDNIDDFVINGPKRYKCVVNNKLYYLGEKCLCCGRPYMVSTKTGLYCSIRCANKIVADKQRLTIQHIRKTFDDIGYTLHTTEYTNQNTMLSYTCDNGHYSKIRAGNWVVGQRCGKCCKNAPVTWKQVIDLFENTKGWKVLSSESEWRSAYKDKVRFRCNEGHTYQYSYTSLKSNNHKCPYCTNTIPILFDDIKRSFNKEGWVVHSIKKDYINQNDTPIDCSCPNGHRQMKSVRKWRIGRRCPMCVVSGPELKVRNILKQLYDGTVIYNDRSLLNGREIDIYLPDIHKAIEYNGDYWHCNPTKYDKYYYHKHKNKYAHEIWSYDVKKYVDCKRLGVDLSVIWESDDIFIEISKMMKDKQLK